MKQGREEGQAKGREEARAQDAIMMLMLHELTQKRGPQPDKVRGPEPTLSLEQCESLADVLLDYETLHDLRDNLEEWLRLNPTP